MSQLGSGSGSSYPSSIDNKQIFRNDVVAAPDSDTRVDAEVINDSLSAIVQIETALGANVQGGFASLAARLDSTLGGMEAPASGLTNVVAFSVPMSVTIPGSAHQQAVPALLYQIYDSATPRQALQPSTVTVSPTSYDVVITFATAQGGVAMVAAPLPYVLVPFSAQTVLTIPGTQHGLGETYLLYQVYDAAVPASAIQVQNMSVHPGTRGCHAHLCGAAEWPGPAQCRDPALSAPLYRRHRGDHCGQ